jgi:hypothetical protein
MNCHLPLDPFQGEEQQIRQLPTGILHLGCHKNGCPIHEVPSHLFNGIENLEYGENNKTKGCLQRRGVGLSYVPVLFYLQVYIIFTHFIHRWLVCQLL